jgi:hypothetical protein
VASAGASGATAGADVAFDPASDAAATALGATSDAVVVSARDVEARTAVAVPARGRARRPGSGLALAGVAAGRSSTEAAVMRWSWIARSANRAAAARRAASVQSGSRWIGTAIAPTASAEESPLGRAMPRPNPGADGTLVPTARATVADPPVLSP